MSPNAIDVSRMLLAGLAAGGWVFVGGILMAGAFGYRDMKTAFDAIGLPLPKGARPFVTHTIVRLAIGMAVATLFAILRLVFCPTTALLVAAGFAWLLGSLLPFAVVVEWGLFSWPLATKLWAWSAGELLIAATIARWVYHL